MGFCLKMRLTNNLTRTALNVPSLPGMADTIVRGFPRAEDESMSIVAWKLMRHLPRPVLLGLLILVLTAAARA